MNDYDGTGILNVMTRVTGYPACRNLQVEVAKSKVICRKM